MTKNTDLSKELIDLEIQLADALRRMNEIKTSAKGINEQIKLIRGQIGAVVEDIESGQMRMLNVNHNA